MSTKIETETNAVFIVVSYFISVLGAFTTFQFINETKFQKSVWRKLLLIACGSVSMGICAIWAMHFIGTLCFSFTLVETLPDSIEVTKTKLTTQYDIGMTIISALVAVILCFVGFFISTVQQFSPRFRRRFCVKWIWQQDEALEREAEAAQDIEVAISGIQSGTSGVLAELRALQHSVNQMMLIDPISNPTSPRKMSALSMGGIPTNARTFNRCCPSPAMMQSYICGSPHKPHIVQIMISSLLSAAGICTMHYLGMIATHVNRTMMVYSPAVVTMACIIAYIACFAAFWLSFNLENHVFQVVSSFVAGIAVGGMHYTGMFSVKYEYHDGPSPHPFLFPSKISNIDLAMGTTIATSSACFFLLVMLASARNVLNRTIKQLKNEKQTVEKYSKKLHLTVVQMNGLLNQIAYEEHQIRRVMDCLTDPVCVVDENGTIIKSNRNFNQICGTQHRQNIANYFPAIQSHLCLNDFFRYSLSAGESSNNIVSCKLRLNSIFQESTVHVRIFQEQHVINKENYQHSPKSFYIFQIQSEDIPAPSTRNFQVSKGGNLVSALEQDLQKREFVQLFKLFCHQEHCAEGVEFLEKVNQYKNCENTIERVEIQKSIAAEFLEWESPNQLNLSRNELERGLTKVQKGYGQLDLFDDMSKQVRELLTHSYSRFKALTQ